MELAVGAPLVELSNVKSREKENLGANILHQLIKSYSKINVDQLDVSSLCGGGELCITDCSVVVLLAGDTKNYQESRVSQPSVGPVFSNNS